MTENENDNKLPKHSLLSMNRATFITSISPSPPPKTASYGTRRKIGPGKGGCPMKYFCTKILFTL